MLQILLLYAHAASIMKRNIFKVKERERERERERAQGVDSQALSKPLSKIIERRRRRVNTKTERMRGITR